jgi:hypothetical protein
MSFSLKLTKIIKESNFIIAKAEDFLLLLNSDY